MQARLIRLRFRRGLRQRQQQVEGLGSLAEENIEEHLFKRFDRLGPVARFVSTWLALVILLIGSLVAQNVSLSSYFQSLKPIPGGMYREGILGRFTNANPLFVTTNADTSVSRLIFAGLLTQNDQGQLVGDLASSYSADSKGSTFTVNLRPNLTWQDGKPLTSADVLFTYQLIENPDTQSPLFNSWRGIEVTTPDAHTVVFKLPGPLASFPYNLTNGIVPKHLLAGVPPSDLRSADFNTVHPVGAGPFVWQGVQVSGNDPSHAQEQIGLTAFKAYHAGGPNLQRFVVRVFASRDELEQAFKTNQLNAVENANDLSPELRTGKGVQTHSLLFRAADMVFFKTSSGILAEKPVRQALVQSANVPAIMNRLDYPTHAVRGPLLTGQLGYDPTVAQPNFNRKAAEKLLDDSGWHAGKNGLRTKDKQILTFSLTVSNTAEYRQVAKQLQAQWKTVGVNVTTRVLDASDFQRSLAQHDYDAVLDAVSLGVDPDVFVYWDSSQADIRSDHRLNLSEYKNSTADTALEAGRTRLDASLRIIKYKPFLQAWQQDAPALGLYQPRLLYLTNGPVSGLTSQAITSPTDRFNNVQDWQIRQAKVTD
jgi:peptide/nickel transport system substrate-binding protein